MHDNVKYEVKNGVVTLTGEVNSQNNREPCGKGGHERAQREAGRE
jgi:hypothetical protein